MLSVDPINMTGVCEYCGSVRLHWNGTRYMCYNKRKEDKKKQRKPVPPETRRSHIYGLTEKKYQAMLTAQDNRCAICQAKLVIPMVDHCHASGRVRKILCTLCNTGLGMFQDNPDLLRAAAWYLEQY